MSLDGSGEGARIKLAKVLTAIHRESVERSELEERHLAHIFQSGHVRFTLAKLTNEFSFGSLRSGTVAVVVVGHEIIIGEDLPDVKLVAPECG